MKGRDPLFSSKSDEWETPQDLFDLLDAVYHFDVDPCATEENRKCPRYFTRAVDGLSQPWYGVVFVNPPYTRNQVKNWLQKGRDEIAAGRATKVVFLLPARTGTAWFHTFVWDSARGGVWPGVGVQFLRGRLKFNGSTNAAPFDSLIVEMS